MDTETKGIILVGLIMLLMSAINVLRVAFIFGSIVFWSIVAFSTITNYNPENSQEGSALKCGGCVLRL